MTSSHNDDDSHLSVRPASDPVGPARQQATSSRRPVRSYVIRGGRLTASQRKALDRYSRDFLVDYQGQALAGPELFGNDQPVIVEIGFGMGDSLLTMARENPQANFIGIEVHLPGIGKLLQGIVEHKIDNIRIINHDAKEVLAQGFGEASLGGIQVFFPDPWHKKRHHKRRLIQPPFGELLARRLQSGGLLHLATDWQNYAEQMLAVLEQEPLLVNEAGAGNYADPGQRPSTKFEKRGQKLGHGVWDLKFRRQSDTTEL